ncbi:MAG: DUF1080 domain-containing protein [Saprospiraceae bacterium]|nr:DUF1080 domain-containing protein [Saprospiraceae bacterium]
MNKNIFFGLAVLFLLSCQNKETLSEKEMEEVVEVIKELPFDTLALIDLSAFENTGQNWKSAGKVTSDYLTEHDLTVESGTGILVNEPQPEDNRNIRTKWNHGDLELKFEVMVPRGSNSGVYFQGRYEVQLFDSWEKSDPTFSDMGGIYQRWDENRPEGQKGYEGIAPRINAAIAPGLWQRYHILFRAPRFDQDGNKIENAHFEFVYLNDQLIHKDVEVSGPTRAHQENGEQPEGPLYFQGDHGPVAFRDIEYKRYGKDSLSLSDLKYQLFEGKYDYIPDFDTLTASSSGTVDYFDLDAVTSQSEGFSVIFEGKLHVPTDGSYLFETQIDDGGDLWIDSVLVVHNEGEPGWGSERGLIHLSPGIRNLKLTYYQEVWSTTLLVFYEGPGISRRSLASFRKKAPWEEEMAQRPPLILKDLENPELLRGFVMYGDQKLTHAISVGDPSGIHYSYDLNTGALVKCWKGAFGDVTEMWQGRGESQLMQPVTPSIQLERSFPIAKLDDKSRAWPEDFTPSLDYDGYTIDSDQRPIFHYKYNEVKVDDKLIPKNGELNRTITLDKIPDESLYVKLGEASKILKLKNGLYSFDGKYYLSTSGLDWEIRQQDGRDQLFAALNEKSLSYNLIW